VSRTLKDRLLKGANGARIHVFRRKGRLGFGGLGDGLFEVAPFGLTPIEDARFVEVNVGLDETG